MPHADLEVRRQYQREYQRKYYQEHTKPRQQERREPPSCKNCGRERPPGGCIPCKRAYQVEWRQKNASRMKVQQREYRLRNLEARRRSHAVWAARNIEHKRTYMREWQRDNPEAVRAASNRRRARKTAVQTIPFTVEQLAAKWSYWGNKCWICREPATQTDHVKPINKGGPHMLANLRPICKPCNCSKSDRWPL